MSNKNTTLRYAEFYAKKGWPVFPCWPDKNPKTAHGCYDGTTDLNQIYKWWSKPNDDNMAISTGNGLVVLDVDIKHHKGKYGDETLADLEQKYGSLPHTPMVLSGGGGVHYYFYCDDPRLTVAEGFQPGLDYRANGGYIICPPSLHQSGNRYEWEISSTPDTVPLAPLPEWLHRLMLEGTSNRKKSATEIPDKIPEGQRNGELFRLASSLRARGLSVEGIQAAIMKENERRCDPPLSADEVTTICNSVGRYEKGQTRSTINATERKDLSILKPETNKRYTWNDIGNGYLFADWYKDTARYAPERKKWMVYDGRRWTPDTGNLRVMEMCKKLADVLMVYALTLTDEKQRGDYIKHVGRWQQRNYREIILKDAASVYPVEIADFDTDPFIFNCTNGTLNLRTRLFHPHKSGDMLSKLAGVSYDPDATSPRWERFIDEIMQSKGKATFLQKGLGYSLTGDTSHECFFMGYGPTSRNGKGTTMETMIQLMGDYGRTATPDTIAQKQRPNGSGPSEDIARLAGARFVNISEPDRKMVLSSALVKTLTGKDKITARYLNENSFEYYPQFKLWINTNHLPTVTDSTLFSSGRVKIIPFDRHFTEAERDEGLKAELSKPENLSAILNWCLEGLWLIEETGFDPPEEVSTATDEYRRSNDKISRFLDDEMEPEPLAETRTSEAYRRYQEWCVSNGFFPENSANFKAALSNLATITRRKPRAGGEKTTLLIGYRLTPAKHLY